MTEFYIDHEYIEEMLQALTKYANDEHWEILDMMFASLQDRLELVVKRLNDNPNSEAEFRQEIDHYIEEFLENTDSLARFYPIDDTSVYIGETLYEAIDTESVLETRPKI